MFTWLSVWKPGLRSVLGRRQFASKIVAPPMVYIKGEEMTRYAAELMLTDWIKPHMDISKWEWFDLSCKARDDTEDKCLRDAVAAGARIKAIFKEPTVTPTEVQKKKMGLKKTWGSPNGAMRRGWNGITISRDTIHIDGIQLGFRKPVLFERHAVGGEYSAGFKPVGDGRLITTFFPENDAIQPIIVDSRHLTDSKNVAVVYHNPLDNLPDLAKIFFERCLSVGVTPYVVTKKTVFKWQEPFWTILKDVFDKDYKEKFLNAGLLEKTNGDLAHLISDAATMQIIRWTDGGFGMACHNYDGDMLTDEVAQVHRSPGFITSNLVGKAADGTLIREYEASHGTVADLWDAHLKGKETSFNPLGMAEALMGAMVWAAEVNGDAAQHKSMVAFTTALRQSLHNTFRYGQGTRDLSGPSGVTTEEFTAKVGWRLGRYLKMIEDSETIPHRDIHPSRQHDPQAAVDLDKVHSMFREYDEDGSGTITIDEFTKMLVKLGVAPRKAVSKGNTPEKCP